MPKKVRVPGGKSSMDYGRTKGGDRGMKMRSTGSYQPMRMARMPHRGTLYKPHHGEK